MDRLLNTRVRFMNWVRGGVRRVIRPILLSEPNHPARYQAYRDSRPDFLIEMASRRDAAPTTPLPVPPRELWVALGPGGYGDTQEEFLQSGREHVANMFSMLAQAGATLGQGSRVLDFGCASGRLTRWLTDSSVEREIWGTDISAEHILWCQRNLSPPLNFCTITTIPHLPFEDRYFELALAGSVFTHIDDLTDAWLLELRRVLRPGGHLYLTVIDKHSLAIVERNPDFNLAKRIAEAKTRIPLETSDFAMVSILRSYTLYDIGYLKEKLGRMYEVVGVREENYGFQTGILVRKKSS